MVKFYTKLGVKPSMSKNTISRRSIFQYLGGLSAFSFVGPAIAGDKIIKIRSIRCYSFNELHNLIDSLPNKQIDGDPFSHFNGIKYKTVQHYALARPGDEAQVEKIVAYQTSRDISDMFDDNVEGTIVWRTRLETEVRSWVVVKEYLEDGILDDNWIKVSTYARLLVV